MASSFEREIFHVALCTILYWAVDTDDLDDTDDLADFLEEVLLAYCLNRQEAEKNPAIIDEDAFEREIYNVALCTILYWAVDTDDLDDTDDLADFLEEVLLAYCLNRQEAENNPAIIEDDANSLRCDAFEPHVDKADKVMKDLLAASPDHFRHICRMQKDTFKKLVYWLRTNTSVRNSGVTESLGSCGVQKNAKLHSVL
ncbi:hypothetical protein E4U09_000368 [Claviceps aff. purpurea]|uniref:Uncharacterized protein n=1 Tax=Claviceps aff. purpurea TaxID=1967640 RepID=A0A9P7TV82_9HYPO|nr:hypothetical protein E4U09_000368 [Claviceps aff. purpurea]